MSLTEREAFGAMYVFLSEVYDRTRSETLGSLLGSMSLLSDGEPADPAIWGDWLECVQRAKSKRVRTDLGIS
jgi:hypothetical protein